MRSLSGIAAALALTATISLLSPTEKSADEAENEMEVMFSMPEEYVLTEAQQKEKEELRESLGLKLNDDGTIDVKPEDFDPGKNVVPDSVVMFTDSLEEAELVASVFNGTVLFCSDGMASIGLGMNPEGKQISSTEAVFASASENTGLPPLYFDHYMSAM